VIKWKWMGKITALDMPVKGFFLPGNTYAVS